jgi:hypothetical protein
MPFQVPESQTLKDPSGKFSVSTPTHWQAVEASPAAIAASANPSYQNARAILEYASRQGFSFFASSGQSSTPAYLGARVFGLNQPVALDAWAREQVATLESSQETIGKVESQTIRTAGGDAVELRYVRTGPPRVGNEVVLEYHAIAGSRVTVLTLASQIDDMDGHALTMEFIGRSLFTAP